MKNYAYAFDTDGYYLGLVRATLDEATKQMIFPKNSTDQEPYWKDGYQSRWDFTLKNWTLEPRAEKKHRMEVEKELLAPLNDRIKHLMIETGECKLDIKFQGAKLVEIKEMLTPINENTILSYQKWIEVKNLLQTYETYLAGITTTIRDLEIESTRHGLRLERMNMELAILAHPTFFQRLKHKISKFFKSL